MELWELYDCKRVQVGVGCVCVELCELYDCRGGWGGCVELCELYDCRVVAGEGVLSYVSYMIVGMVDGGCM